MRNNTSANIEKKRKLKRRRRRVKVGRLFVCLLLITVLLTGVGWGGYYVYQWGTAVKGMYDQHQLQAEIKRKSQDQRFVNYTNILLLGLDESDPQAEQATRRADTIVLLSFDKVNGKVRFLSIPRDTLVTIPGRKSQETINNAYCYGGAPLTQQVTGQLLNIAIHEYIAVDIKGMTALVDALGGIDLYVEDDMNYEDPAAELAIHLHKGYQHLSGDLAQQYLRFRSDDLGDLGRVHRQQRFIKAMYEKITRPDTLTKLPAAADVMEQQVVTSLELNNVQQWLTVIRGLQTEHPAAGILPGSQGSGDSGWLPDQGRIAAQMQEMFPETAVANENK